jgi:hypothetical protein
MKCYQEIIGARFVVGGLPGWMVKQTTSYGLRKRSGTKSLRKGRRRMNKDLRILELETENQKLKSEIERLYLTIAMWEKTYLLMK